MKHETTLYRGEAAVPVSRPLVVPLLLPGPKRVNRRDTAGHPYNSLLWASNPRHVGNRRDDLENPFNKSRGADIGLN